MNSLVVDGVHSKPCLASFPGSSQLFGDVLLGNQLAGGYKTVNWSFLISDKCTHISSTVQF